MGWGVGAALGQALSRMGNTWGSERIDLRRQLEDDQRRAAAHELALKTGNARLETEGLQQAGMRQDQAFNDAANPTRLDALKVELANARARGDREAIMLAEAKLEQAGKAAVNFHQRMPAAQVAAAELSDDQIRSQMRNADAQRAIAQGQLSLAEQANGRAEDAAARQEEAWQATAGQRTPWYLAENDPNIKGSVETLRRSVASMNAAHLNTLRGQLTGTQLPGAEAQGGGMLADPAYQAMAKQIAQMAEQIAIGIVDQYEANHARQQGGPAWARPEDRLGAIEKLKKKYMGALVNGEGGLPGAGGPPAGGAGVIDPNAI